MKNINLLVLLIFPSLLFGQYCDSFELTLEDSLEMGCTNNALTALHDNERAYLYVANAEGGLSVLSLEDPTEMEVIANVPSTSFDGLTVNRIIQLGENLYIPIGSMFGAHDQPSGLAIVNVDNPLFPEVTDVWTSEEDAGAAHVAIHGNFAYLCGLSNGVIVLNIIDPYNITFMSQYIPPTDWPEETDVNKIKARNIVIEGERAYLAYDAGGMRILQIGAEPWELSEIGRYSNPALNGAARAYNNIVKRGDLLYIAVDYAGMEVLDVSNPAEVTLHGWWNPNGFPLGSPFETSGRWFSSPWHTNEIALIDACNTIFMSAGRTEVVGVDVSDPSEPFLCGFYGDSSDAVSSYGMTVYEDRIYVGHICSPLPIPFPAEWSGVRALIYDSDCPLSLEEETRNFGFSIFPNPAKNEVQLQLNATQNASLQHVSIHDISGKRLVYDTSGTLNIDISELETGIYLVNVKIDDQLMTEKLIIH